MRTATLPSLFLVAAVLLPAPGSARAQGINLAWDDCYLGAATTMKTFACDTDAGAPFTLIGSFVPPPGVGQLVGMTAILDLCTMPVVLPDWWRIGTGDCREGAITTSFDFTAGPFSCPDPWQGQAMGGFGSQVATLGPTRLRLTIVCGITTPVAVSATLEYYAFKVRISRAGSSGAGACGGCLTNACIVLNEIRLAQPAGVGDFVMTSPAVSYDALWQGANQSPQCPFVVPARESSWGGVKALFR